MLRFPPIDFAPWTSPTYIFPRTAVLQAFADGLFNNALATFNQAIERGAIIFPNGTTDRVDYVDLYAMVHDDLPARGLYDHGLHDYWAPDQDVIDTYSAFPHTDWHDNTVLPDEEAFPLAYFREVASRLEEPHPLVIHRFFYKELEYLLHCDRADRDDRIAYPFGVA